MPMVSADLDAAVASYWAVRTGVRTTPTSDLTRRWVQMPCRIGEPAAGVARDGSRSGPDQVSYRSFMTSYRSSSRAAVHSAIRGSRHRSAGFFR